MTASPIEALQALGPAEQDEFLRGLSEEEAAALLRSWEFWARPEQLAPEWAWRWWMLVTGRGWGKNRTGAEWVVNRCEQFAEANVPHLVGLLGQTNDDVKKVMIGGVSGLKRAVERRGHRWEGAESTLEPKILVRRADGTWHTTLVEIHTAIEPEGPRGRNFDTLWVDELAAFRHKVDPLGNTVFTNADLALRGGAGDLSPPGRDAILPQGVITTTPKPIPVIRDLLASKHGPTAVTRGSMYDNQANLPEHFITAIRHRYEGTRLAVQEIHGEVIDSVEGALWTPDIIHAWRLAGPHELPVLSRVVVGVDPSGSEAEGDQCGIVVVGLGRDPDLSGRPHLYVLEDGSSVNRPEKWARTVVDLARKYDATIVAEVNFGAALVADVIKLTARNDEAELPPGAEPLAPVRFEEVRASRGKRIRAEPVALLYDPGQGRVHHVGVFPELEEQMCYWTPLDPSSPDRLDALVWACAALIPDLTVPPAGFAKGWADRRAG